ncbi:CPBP family intramembrane glutamic endopeptidase [Neobacillus drentensis]|uniref:CPBP family intramembrane glutamic endopeptidase n=2 Tax=Neobacillus drentensis TaxID=220684 RepID=UPI00300264DC
MKNWLILPKNKVKLTIFSEFYKWWCKFIKNLFRAIAGFVILDLYFNLVTVQLGNPYLQFGSTLLFFPLAYYIAKWVGLDGLKGLGMMLHPGWKKNFFYSFTIGFSFWMLMFGFQFLNGELEFIGVKRPADVIMPIIEVFVGYFVGSLINDLITRGYIIQQLKGRIHIYWVFTISIMIYALDDYWYAGLSISNIIFSILLGLSLTYAFYKTGSIWADSGIHYGLNVAYGLFYGLVGNPEGGILKIREHGHETVPLQYIVPAMMFLFVFRFQRFYRKNTTIPMKKVPFST